MLQEIEHKYLVRKDLWYAVHKPTGMRILQGYLLADPEKTIRIRIAGTNGFLTIKGPPRNASRAEYEYPILITEAEELMQLCVTPPIEKVRYKIEYCGKIWDVDEFFGENEGLILAEIELAFEGETYKKPTWVGEEVTDDARYYNSYLAVNPLSTWK
ncbi:MAG: CYTH domain-containing protein [Bacteroidales bacterium]|jgi:CYTH domain-containing protein